MIGVVETHGRAGIAELSSKLETVPRRQVQYKGASFEEMDLEAILDVTKALSDLAKGGPVHSQADSVVVRLEE